MAGDEAEGRLVKLEAGVDTAFVPDDACEAFGLALGFHAGDAVQVIFFNEDEDKHLPHWYVANKRVIGSFQMFLNSAQPLTRSVLFTFLNPQAHDIILLRQFQPCGNRLFLRALRMPHIPRTYKNLQILRAYFSTRV